MRANKNLMLNTAAAALIAAAMAVPAHAADAIFDQPPAPPAAPFTPAPVATWEGPYAGAAVGYGFSGRTRVTDPAGVQNTINTDGFVGNVFGGYNWQSDMFVFGAEADVGYNGMSGRNAGQRAKHGVDGSLRARVGVAATDDVMVYATAGGAGGRVKVEDDVLGSQSKTMFGWTAGAGVDVKLTEQAFARVEYRYTDLGKKTFDLGGVDHDVRARSNRVMVGVGINF